MHRARLHSRVLSFTLTVAVAAAATGQSPVAVIQIGPFDGGDVGEAHAINNAGVVAATQFVGLTSVAYIWDHGEYTYLGSINGGSTIPLAINDRNDVVGSSNILGFNRHAFLWSNGQMTDLGTFGGDESSAEGISESGVIVGWAEVEAGTTRGFVWQRGVMQMLATLGGTNSFGWSNSSDGAFVVGSARLPNEYFHAALWTDPETVIDLGLFIGDRFSQAYAVNDLGHVVGYSGNGGSENHAFLWRDNTLIDIHQRGVSPYSMAQDINDQGEIVGYGNTYNSSRAVYWTPQLHMIDLNEIIPPRSGWVLEVANQINDAGQIACQARRSGVSTGALVSPVYPTMNLSAPSPGAAGASNTLAVSGVTPGKRIAFLYSRRGGGAIIPGCNLQQNALQIEDPTLIGTTTADANGVASITRTVPLIARGQTILFQAVVQNECAISQLVVHEFE